MTRPDGPDLWGGAILAALGIGVCAYSAAQYDLGSLRQMGPGFFPAALGLILAFLGLMIALPAARRAPAVSTERPSIALPELLAVIAAIVIFGLLMNRLGLILTSALAVMVATLPARRAGLTWRLVLTLVLTVLVWLVFSVALDMTIPVWPWSR